ncbi:MULTISPECIES: 2-hydroxyacid dehydrogenase [unclassified Sedimentibacter]|uniref:2-hydroxyacid dehydrogenase n=1 Tax=unclassified Sedimentibacter TaxID=2649220 RepID=UPI0027DFBD56|nr:D-glycerate dehydrogenase [Sedimentibacter sp. MB35-C1]WMJ76772.1 D-glycerate dehydrogenase [Sedimentibacter sp. MB35-C1]
MKPKVYIAKKIPHFVEEYIGQHCDYEKYEGNGIESYDELIVKLKDKEGLLTVGTRVDENFLEHAPKLKVVSNISVGYNNFDIQAMKKRNIIGTNTPGVLNDTVADLVFALILSTARKVVQMDRYVREGMWNSAESEEMFGKDVHHATLGIIGMGRIGEDVAKRARYGFNMDVLYYNRSRKIEAEKTMGVKYADLNMLLQKSDFILIMTALTDETYHMIDKEQFNMMKDDAIFINASRGSTVNEKALIEALKNKKILGAGLDVYEQEPIDKCNPLLNMDNVVLLPHIGSATKKTRDDMAMLAAQNLVKALFKEVPPNVVPELK